MRDTKRKGGDAGALTGEEFGHTDPNAGIPPTSPGGGLVEPGRTDIGSAPLGTGDSHGDRAQEDNIYGGPRAIDYNDEDEAGERE
jgi:hypothetical protein